MAVSNVKDLIGIELPSDSLAIEAGKIKELAQAIGDDNPIYASLQAAKEAGYDGIPVPLTFLQVIDSFGGSNSFEETMALLQLNPLRVLHGEQEYEFFAPIYAGDTLSVSSTVVHAETKSGGSGNMDLIVQQHQYTNQDNIVVAQARRTIVHRY